MRNRQMITINLKCPDCKNIFPIPRFKNSLREKNHKKKIWCPWCKIYQNMEELNY